MQLFKIKTLVLMLFAWLLLSGDGVTVSGGEPLFQPEFTAALLKALLGKRGPINTSCWAENIRATT